MDAGSVKELVLDVLTAHTCRRASQPEQVTLVYLISHLLLSMHSQRFTCNIFCGGKRRGIRNGTFCKTPSVCTLNA